MAYRATLHAPDEVQVTDSVGWMGLGFGRQMANTHMVIMWDNEDGTTTLSQRYSRGHSEPKLVDSPPWHATFAQPSKAVRPTGSTAFAFKIFVNETHFKDRFSVHSIIWAYSRSKPSSSDPSSSLAYHNARGSSNLEFKSQPNTTSTPSNEVQSQLLNGRERVMFLHGVLVSFGFLVVLPTGAIVARYARTFTTEWIKVHQICNMLIGLPVITLGTILGPIAILLSGGLHLTDAHQICGLILLAMYCFQVWLGRHIHHQRFTKSSAHPIPNVIHVAIGLVTVGSAIFQVRGGLYEWEAKTGRPIPKICFVLWKASSVALPLLYLGGLTFLPRQFRQEKDAVKSEHQYIALSEGSHALRMDEVIGDADEDGSVGHS